MTQPEPHSWRSPRAIRAASLAAATVLLFALIWRLDGAGVAAAWARAERSWLLAAIGLNATVLIFGGLQWHALLPSGGFVARGRMIRIFATTSVANNTAPSLVGHALGAMLIGAERGVGRAAGLSVIALDQLCVGLAKLAVLLLAATVAPMPAWMRSGILVLAVVVVGLAIALGSAAWRGAALGNRLAGVPFLAERRWAAEGVRQLVSAFGSVRDPRRLALAAGLALLSKLSEAAGIVAVQQAFGFDASVASAALVLAATSLSSVVPITPGNLGTYEAATFAAYRALGAAPEAALSIAIAQHACLLIAAIAPGYVYLALARRSAPDAETHPGRVRVSDAGPDFAATGVDPT